MQLSGQYTNQNLLNPAFFLQDFAMINCESERDRHRDA